MAHFIIYPDARGEYRWRFRADNNKIIADSSEGYRNKADCEAAIRLLKQQAPSASVIDQTTSGRVPPPPVRL